MTNAPLIAVHDLSQRYGTETALSLSDWTVGAREACLILGASGSGKSTLLTILAGLARPSTGTVHVAGEDLHTASRARLDRWRGRKLGIVFQSMRLVPALSVLANLKLAQSLSGAGKDIPRLKALLERVNLSHRAHALPRTLSVGEAQRAAIARALAGQPALILADEPTSALDDANAEQVAELLADEASRLGAGLIIATHDQRIKDRFSRHLVLEARAR